MGLGVADDETSGVRPRDGVWAEPGRETGDWTEVATSYGAPSFWALEEARTAVGAPAFRPPAESTSGELPSVEVEIPAEPAGVPVEPAASVEPVASVEPGVSVEPVPSVEVELGELDAPFSEPATGPASLEVEVDLAPPVRAPSAPRLAVAVAPRSESFVWEGLDGEAGVFVATYAEHPIGAAVELELHLMGEGSFTAPGTVRFVRAAGDCWPGLGVELDRVSPELDAALTRFARPRPPRFH